MHMYNLMCMISKAGFEIRRSFALGSHWNVGNSSVGHLMRSMFWEDLCAEGVNPSLALTDVRFWG